jgi:4-hydroxy-tetrahydrodipicolinate reductase
MMRLIFKKENMVIRVIVNGFNGKVGKEIVKALTDNNEIILAGQTGRNDNLENEIKSKKAQVVVDFTHPSVVYNNIRTIIKSGAHAVVGTTGLKEEQKIEINKMAKDCGLGVLIAPNFCIGAVLMMKFAAEAAKYLPYVEIIEYHHNQKADAPSGTSVKTAEFINSVVGKTNPPTIESKEDFGSPLGAKIGNIRIHSIRLPGFIASQEVILGENGETLKIRHDTINRESFIPGILLGIKNIMNYEGLVDGLEQIL